VIENNGGRDRDRTCDPYDVNVGASPETAEPSGFSAEADGFVGITFPLRPVGLAPMFQSALRTGAVRSPVGEEI
jgi:hypothetical protein